jgi:rRNA maturation endonuclease Nob1
MDGIDLRKYQKEGEEKEQIKDVLGKILSGRSDYRTIIDDTKPTLRCNCGQILEGGEKFCPECGTKVLVCSATNKDCEIN